MAQLQISEECPLCTQGLSINLKDQVIHKLQVKLQNIPENLNEAKLKKQNAFIKLEKLKDLKRNEIEMISMENEMLKSSQNAQISNEMKFELENIEFEIRKLSKFIKEIGYLREEIIKWNSIEVEEEQCETKCGLEGEAKCAEIGEEQRGVQIEMELSECISKM